MARDKSRIPRVSVIQRHPHKHVKENKQVVSPRNVTPRIGKNLQEIQRFNIKKILSAVCTLLFHKNFEVYVYRLTKQGPKGGGRGGGGGGGS